ncbi:MAG TPA: hypothetical protein VMD04_04675 [Candidatus Margulisiibacteriota bacterium]|nr:hypothetical protein [Candidatus Margulisiibacteriota bacterium]
MPENQLQEAKTIMNPAALAGEWILSSGIQSEKGPFYSWYDLDKKRYPYIYSEITGYGITTLLFLYKLSGENKLVKKAKLAAQWIIENALDDSGGVKARLYGDECLAESHYSFEDGNIFSFDTGMVLYALINLYKVTGENLYLEKSKAIAAFLLDTMLQRDGSMAAIFNSGSKKGIESYDKWSNQPGAFHAKVSLGLVDLFEVTRDGRHKEAALELCDFAIGLQEASSGRFITNKSDNTTHLHPHSYAIEGLWYAGVNFGVSRFIDSARRATKWMLHQASGSGLNELYNPSSGKFNDFQRSDILAQALRLALLFGIKDRQEELKVALLQYQYRQEETVQEGGLFFSKDSRHLNSWCTMFALQALKLADNKELLPEGKKLELFI